MKMNTRWLVASFVISFLVQVVGSVGSVTQAGQGDDKSILLLCYMIFVVVPNKFPEGMYGLKGMYWVLYFYKFTCYIVDFIPP